MSLDPRLAPVAGVADEPGFEPGVACSTGPMTPDDSPPLSDDALFLVETSVFFFFLPVMMSGGSDIEVSRSPPMLVDVGGAQASPDRLFRCTLRSPCRRYQTSSWDQCRTRLFVFVPNPTSLLKLTMMTVVSTIRGLLGLKRVASIF